MCWVSAWWNSRTCTQIDDSDVNILPKYKGQKPENTSREPADFIHPRIETIVHDQVACHEQLRLYKGHGHSTQHADASVQSAEAAVTSLACQTTYTGDVIPPSDVIELCRPLRDQVEKNETNIGTLHAEYELFKSQCHCKASSTVAAKVNKGAKDKSKKRQT